VIDIQRLIGYDALESTILVLECLHLSDVTDFHAAELSFPFVERRLTRSVSRQTSLVALPGTRATARIPSLTLEAVDACRPGLGKPVVTD